MTRSQSRRYNLNVDDTASLIICKRVCDVKYPFNKSKRVACKTECHTLEAVQDLSGFGGVTTTVTPDTGTVITSVVIDPRDPNIKQEFYDPIQDIPSGNGKSLPPPTDPYIAPPTVTKENMLDKYMIPIVILGAGVLYFGMRGKKKKRK
jgi:hypothetical protein